MDHLISMICYQIRNEVFLDGLLFFFGPCKLYVGCMMRVGCHTPSHFPTPSFPISAQSPHIAENPKQDISYPFYNKCPLTDIEPTLVGNLINSQFPAVCIANYSWHLMEL